MVVQVITAEAGIFFSFFRIDLGVVFIEGNLIFTLKAIRDKIKACPVEWGVFSRKET